MSNSYTSVTGDPNQGSNNNQIGIDQTTGLASLSDQLFGTGPAVQGPNSDAYNYISGQLNNDQANWGSANPLTATASQINNPYAATSRTAISNSNLGIGNAAGLLGQTALGQGPAAAAAQAQMEAATTQNIASQMAMARSATGGAGAQSAAQLQGQGNIAQAEGTAAANSQATMAQMENAAAGESGQLYGQQAQSELGEYNLEQANAQNQAQLNTGVSTANMNSGNQFYLGAGGLQSQELGQMTGVQNAYNTEALGAQGLQMQENAQANQQGTALTAALMQMAASAGGAGAMSDINTKTGIQPEGAFDATQSYLPNLATYDSPIAKPASSSSGSGMSSGQMASIASMMGGMTSDERAKNVDSKDRTTLADDFLNYLHPESFTYKDPQDEPRSAPTGGRYLGTMAQDLERVPSIGSQLISDTPRGKMIEPRVALSAALAGLGRLNERVKELEGSHGR